MNYIKLQTFNYKERGYTMKSSTKKASQKIHINEEFVYDFKDQECEIGIDEAGRGPVLGKFSLYFIVIRLGPMVYGCCFWPISQGNYFKKEYGFTGT